MAKLLHRMVVTGDAFQILILLFVQLGICLAAERFSASFVFGDSLVEAGNNNYIQSLSKANYPPNGIDFGKPTGRYTNNRTIVDIIGSSYVFCLHMTEQYHEFFVSYDHIFRLHLQVLVCYTRTAGGV